MLDSKRLFCGQLRISPVITFIITKIPKTNRINHFGASMSTNVYMDFRCDESYRAENVLDHLLD